jgi:cysteinyl-tRNA synthetase
VTLRFYDTASAEVRDFVPLVPGKVSLYYCGATVQGMPHVGHIRSAIAFDQLTRWLEYRGFRVTVVRNVTDIDDKILAKSEASFHPDFEQEPGSVPEEEWWALAYRYEQEFLKAYDTLGVSRPTYEPRATGHIPEMHALIQLLIDRGHAYPALDGSGDVYFDVRSWNKYGALTRQKIDDMQGAADADPRGKKDSRDFALWKGYKEGEPTTASWVSPWGAGRPGWHLECSAMVTKYLGAEFDIHGGGLDLRFPHHENEMAQSQAAGHGFANFWMHNGMVTYQGEKCPSPSATRSARRRCWSSHRPAWSATTWARHSTARCWTTSRRRCRRPLPPSNALTASWPAPSGRCLRRCPAVWQPRHRSGGVRRSDGRRPQRPAGPCGAARYGPRRKLGAHRWRPRGYAAGAGQRDRHA